MTGTSAVDLSAPAHAAQQPGTSSPAGERPMPRWKYLWNAIRNPAAYPPPHSLLRQWLLRPRVFDLVSCTMQLLHYQRLARIQRAYASSDPFVKKVQNYNAGVTARKEVVTGRRAEPLYQILTTPRRDLSNERLLIIGPRNVHELFMAWLYGYRWRHIDAIDLYSLHPKIRVMNMEHMTFADGSLDAVAMSNTLSYAKDTFRCLSEVCRVLKPGGRFTFEAVYFPESQHWPGDKVSGNEIRRMLKQLGLELMYYRSFDKINALGGLQTTHVFCVRKDDPQRPSFDHIDW